MTPPVPPEQDISPFMRAVAAGMILCAAIGGFGVVALVIVYGRAIDKWMVVLVGLLPLLLILGALIIWRPVWMRSFLETIADRLPIFKFQKAPPT